MQVIFSFATVCNYDIICTFAKSSVFGKKTFPDKTFLFIYGFYDTYYNQVISFLICNLINLHDETNLWNGSIIFCSEMWSQLGRVW